MALGWSSNESCIRKMQRETPAERHFVKFLLAWPWLTLLQWKYVLDVQRVTDYLAVAWLDGNNTLGIGATDDCWGQFLNFWAVFSCHFIQSLIPTYAF